MDAEHEVCEGCGDLIDPADLIWVQMPIFNTSGWTLAGFDHLAYHRNCK